VQDEAAVNKQPRKRLRPQRRRLPRHPVRPGHRLAVGLPQHGKAVKTNMVSAKDVRVHMGRRPMYDQIDL